MTESAPVQGRWVRRPEAAVELLLLVVAIAVVALVMGWVGKPVPDLVANAEAGCPVPPRGSPVVRLELAFPGTGDAALPTIGQILGCAEGAGADQAAATIGRGLRASTQRDFLLIPLYVGLLLWTSARLAGFGPGRGGPVGRLGRRLAVVDGNDRGRLVAQIAAWSVVAAGLLDVAENVLLLRTASNAIDGGPAATDDIEVGLTAGFAIAKFALLLLPIGLGLLLVRRLVGATRRSRSAVPTTAKVHVPDRDLPERRWVVPATDAEGNVSGALPTNGKDYGICFSGGGIRSATFALGAVQALEEPSAGRWSMAEAEYVSAVSGGSYLAAAYQFLVAGAGPEEDGDRPAADAQGRVIPPNGGVEDHLRRHSTHLADGAAEWGQALGEVVLRAGTGLVLLLLLIWSVAVPLGWAYQYVLFGLEVDRDPVTSIDLRILAAPATAFVVFWLLRLFLVRPVDALAGERVGQRTPASPAGERARAAMAYGTAALAIIGLALPVLAANIDSAVTTVGRWAGVTSDPPPDADDDEVRAQVEAVLAGTSTAARAAVDGAAAVGDRATALGSLGAAARSVELAALQARAAVDDLARAMDDDDDDVDDPPEPPALAVPFDPATCAVVAAATDGDEAEADSLSVQACQAASAAADAAAALAALTVAAADDPATTTDAAADLADAVDDAVDGASRAAAAVRDLADELEGEPDGSDGIPLRWAGVSALLTAIGGLRAKRNLDVAKGPKAKDPETSAPPGGKGKGKAVATTLGFGSLFEVAAGIGVAVLAAIAVSDVVVDAWRRGATEPMQIGVTLDAWQWWVAAVVALAILWRVVNVNQSSLRPFYHRRLWLPYAVTRRGTTAPWTIDTRLSRTGARQPGFPELIVVAAAQSSGREAAPPGRRALPFVFTAKAVGGPDVGYVGTEALEAFLGDRHRSPFTLFGAVATSGAAFGPAMGRHSKGGLGAVMAVANARLGAWVPNPRHLDTVAKVAAAEGVDVRAGAIAKRPWLAYWFAEILGQYPRDARLVLTTDGGHVENLGLVELLRRRCRYVFCFDASGAGATPATLAEAIVLAREELGVDIEIDEHPPPPDPPPPPGPALLDVAAFGADPLRRPSSAAQVLAERIAGRPVLTATIRYPAIPGAPATEGRLVYGTLALGDAGPEAWDVLEYAHRHDIFPNDGTGRQWFDASTFSAYQRLGYLTAKRMVAVADDVSAPG